MTCGIVIYEADAELCEWKMAHSTAMTKLVALCDRLGRGALERFYFAICQF